MTKRQRAAKRCDAAFSRYVRARDRGRCYTCGSTLDIECGHLITCERKSTRWDPLNAKAQCAICNSLHEEDTKPFVDKWIAEYGQAAYDYLMRKSWRPWKYSVDEIEELIKLFNHLEEEEKAMFCE